MSRESITMGDGTTVSRSSTDNFTVPGQVLVEQISRSNIVKGNGVNPTPYLATIFKQRVPMLSGWNEQTVHYDHSGPMLARVLHLDTGIGQQTVWRQRTLAVNSAISNVKGQKVNLSMAYAQRKESLVLVRNTTMQVVTALSAIARKDWPALRRAIGESEFDSKRKLASREDLLRRLKHGGKNVSSKHLAAVFGIAPLISDIQGALDEVMSDPRPLEFVASGRSKVNGERKATTSSSWIAWPYGSAYPSQYGPQVHTETKSTASSRCFLRFRIESSALQDASRLGLINPAYTLWDYIPWSFAFDWVVNIGQWLNSLDYDAGLTFVCGCSSEQLVHSTTVNYDSYTLESTSGYPPVKRTVVSANYTPGVAYTKRFERVVWPQAPSTTLQFKNPFSIFTVAAAIALAAQMMNVKRSFAPRAFSYKPRKKPTLKPIKWVKP